jgi:hypothetical protein
MRLGAGRQVHHSQRLSCRIGAFLSLGLLLFAARAESAPAPAQLLAHARQLYNERRYDQAITEAYKVLGVPTLASSARLVVGRAHLELFRQTSNAAELVAGRDVLKEVRPEMLSAGDRLELLLGLGEALYLDNEFAPASEIFASALGPNPGGASDLHATILDWWASALERVAMEDPADEQAVYAQIVSRMQVELEADPASTSAAYWLAAASRGAGDLEHAWDAAKAGWVRALLSPEHAQTLRADLDELVRTAIIPERAGERGSDREESIAEMTREWEQIKENWKQKNEE